MTGNDEFGPYGSKTAKQNAEKLKNHLRSLYVKLKSRNKETENEISVALELKTDLHLKRLVDTFALSKATIAEIVEDVGKLICLNEPDDSAAMQEYNSWDRQFTELSEKVRDAESKIGKAMAEAVRQQPAAVAAAAPGAQRPNLIKANDPLRPKELQLDDKPSVLRLFKREFEDYYESNQMESLTVRVQQNHFVQCLSTKLKIKVRQKIAEITPVLAVKHDPGAIEPESCCKILDDIFRAQHPMVRRRQDFFMYMQKPKQKTSDYMD